MRVPLSWLREFTDCALSAEDIAKRLTESGLEVEGIERIGAWSHEVRVARVTGCEAHPDAGDLRVVTLDLGDGRSATAVTGAPNVPAGTSGGYVAAALPGAVLVDPHAEGFDLATVAARDVRGVRSDAVLCSEAELGLSGDHSGVLFLEAAGEEGRERGPRPGEPVVEHRPPAPDAPADIVLDIAILPVYGRCLSIVGMAREVAALTRSSFRLALEADHLPLDPNALEIEIDDPALCRRYSGFVLEGVEARPSPAWMQRRLVLAGHKPINCLVDVTNYVMVELGQPMHAFDLDRLPGRGIRVRRAHPGESMHTLDQRLEGEEPEPARELDDSVLLITSGDEPVAVAGVIGGLQSQIHGDTRRIFLESANFDPVSVRRTTSLLKVSTDSSYRFSREVDPALTTVSIQRAVRLLRDITGATPSGGICDRYPRPAERREIEVTPADISRTLGMEVSAEEIRGALERLGFDTEPAEGGEAIRVEIPGYRPDVSIPHDVAEEVIRVLGFDRLPPRRLEAPIPEQRRDRGRELREDMRDWLVGAGLQDVVTYSLTNREAARRQLAPDAEEPEWIEVRNPSSRERSVLRHDLLTGLLEATARNHRHRDRIALFEIGPVWRPEEGKDDAGRPAEQRRLGIVLSGPVEEPTWREDRPRDAGFFDGKGLVEGLARRLHVEDIAFRRVREHPWHPGVAAEVLVGGEPAGQLGRLHPEVIEAWDLGRRTVFAAELPLAPWIEAARRVWDFEPFSRFPPVFQDLNLVVPETAPADGVAGAVREAAGPLLRSLRVLNLYRGEQIGEGKKSLAFRLEFCADDRSLEEEEVNELREAMLPRLREAIGAEIR